MSRDRLLQIQAEIRKLPDSYEYRPNDWKKPHGERIGGALLAEALDLGAFTSQHHTAMRATLLGIIHDTDSGRPADSRRCAAFMEAGGWLHGEVRANFGHAAWRDDCHAIADAIKAEVADDSGTDDQHKLKGTAKQEPIMDERTPPMSKAELARRIQGCNEARPRQVAWERFDIKSVSKKKWTIGLNSVGVDAAMRKRLESTESH